MRRFFRFFLWCFRLTGLFFLGSLMLTAAYSVVPVPLTPIMLIRVLEGALEGRWVGIEKRWVPYEEISPSFIRAVVSGEDARFMRHDGVDWKAVEAAQRYNALHRGRRTHGASTITMQTAKNTFLWHGRNYVRKGLEMYYTFLIEKLWGKRRILEVYANIVELGDGVYGVEAAAQRYFGKSAAALSKTEAARIAAVLPNPRRWSPAAPTAYIQGRVNFIMGRMNGVAIPRD